MKKPAQGVRQSAAAVQAPSLDKDAELVQELFDAAWFKARYKPAGASPLADFCRKGWLQGQDPNPRFWTRLYLACYPDVAASGQNPVLHYIRNGRAEGRVVSCGAVTSSSDGIIAGWAADPDDVSASSEVRLRLPGIELVRRTNGISPALAAAGVAANAAAFKFALSALTREQIIAVVLAAKDGVVRLHVSSAPTGLELLGSPITLSKRQFIAYSCQSMLAAAPIEGSLDDVVHGYAVGWCFQRGQVAPLSVCLRIDGEVVATGEAGLFRADVGTVHGEPMCGYRLALPVSAFDGQAHLVTVEDVVSGTTFSKNAPVVLPVPVSAQTPRLIERLESFLQDGSALLEQLSRGSRGDDAPLESWDTVFRRRLRATPAELARQRSLAPGFGYRPLISIVMPVYNPIPAMLTEAIESVLAQTYDNWELLIVDDASPDDGIRQIIRQFSGHGGQIRAIFGESNAGISANTNRGLAEAKGDYVSFFDHDDVLEPEALFAVVSALQHHRYQLIYTDEDLVTAAGDFINPHLKPNWDPIFLAGINYVCHFVTISRPLLVELGPLDPAFDGCQDKEFLLRAAARLADGDVHHIDRVVYHWRFHASSFSKDATKVESITALSKTSAHAWARSFLGDFSCSSAVPASYFAVHLKGLVPEAARPLISVIITAEDRADQMVDCILSLRKGVYLNLEIIVVDHDGASMSESVSRTLGSIEGVTVLTYRGRFNWAAINNFAAAEAKGELLFFVNSGTSMIDADAVEQMAAYALAPNMGVAGGKLLYGNGRVEHAGLVVGAGGTAIHPFVGLGRDAPAYYGYAMLNRSVSAVSGACMMLRRSLFIEVGGFDAVMLPDAFADADLCLKVQAVGKRNVLLATAQFYRFGSTVRTRHEPSAFRQKWGQMIDADPYYNSRFDPNGEPYQRIQTNYTALSEHALATSTVGAPILKVVKGRTKAK